MDKKALAKFLIKKETLSLEDLTSKMLNDDDPSFLKLVLNYVEIYNDIDFLYKTIYSDDGFDLVSLKTGNDCVKWFKVLYDGLGKITNNLNEDDAKLLYQNYGDLLHEFLVENDLPYSVVESVISAKIPYIGYYSSVAKWADLLTWRNDVNNLSEMVKFFNLYKSYPKSLEILVKSYCLNIDITCEDISAIKDLNILSESNLYYYITTRNSSVKERYNLIEFYSLNLTVQQFNRVFSDVARETKLDLWQKLGNLIQTD